jgi:hypothetical protein
MRSPKGAQNIRAFGMEGYCQRVGTSYNMILASPVTSVSELVCAWATRMRSNGSAWWCGSTAAASISACKMGRKRISRPAIRWTMRSTEDPAKGRRWTAALFTTSQSVARLTRSSLVCLRLRCLRGWEALQADRAPTAEHERRGEASCSICREQRRAVHQALQLFVHGLPLNDRRNTKFSAARTEDSPAGCFGRGHRRCDEFQRGLIRARYLYLLAVIDGGDEVGEMPLGVLEVDLHRFRVAGEAKSVNGIEVPRVAVFRSRLIAPECTGNRLTART